MEKWAWLKFLMVKFCLLLSFCSAEDKVDYDNVTSWAGICQSGSYQSPVDIDSKNIQFCPNITTAFKYLCKSSALEGQDLSFTVQSENSGFIGINDKTGNGPEIRLYEAKQFHFHSPSEHSINGKKYALQMHNFFLPLSDEDGKNENITKSFVNFQTSNYTKSTTYAAVLSYLFYPSNDEQAINFNLHVNENGTAQINRLQLFGCTTTRFWYHYRGSTTIPPCTQNVDWFVYREPLPLKKSQLEAIVKKINNGLPNSRPTQSINQRTIYLVGDACNLI